MQRRIGSYGTLREEPERTPPKVGSSPHGQHSGREQEDKTKSRIGSFPSLSLAEMMQEDRARQEKELYSAKGLTAQNSLRTTRSIVFGGEELEINVLTPKRKKVSVTDAKQSMKDDSGNTSAAIDGFVTYATTDDSDLFRHSASDSSFKRKKPSKHRRDSRSSGSNSKQRSASSRSSNRALTATSSLHHMMEGSGIPTTTHQSNVKKSTHSRDSSKIKKLHDSCPFLSFDYGDDFDEDDKALSPRITKARPLFAGDRVPSASTHATRTRLSSSRRESAGIADRLTVTKGTTSIGRPSRRRGTSLEDRTTNTRSTHTKGSHARSSRIKDMTTSLHKPDNNKRSSSRSRSRHSRVVRRASLLMALSPETTEQPTSSRRRHNATTEKTSKTRLHVSRSGLTSTKVRTVARSRAPSVDRFHRQKGTDAQVARAKKGLSATSRLLKSKSTAQLLTATDSYGKNDKVLHADQAKSEKRAADRLLNRNIIRNERLNSRTLSAPQA